MGTPPKPWTGAQAVLTSKGVKVKDVWLRSCYDHIIDLHGKPEVEKWDSTVLADKIFEQFLLADLQQSSDSTFPESLQDRHTKECTLQGTYLVQLDQGVNIASSNRARFLKLLLRYGSQQVVALEHESIPQLKGDPPAPGIKLLIGKSGAIRVRRGVLLLGPQDVEVLGGTVAELHSQFEREEGEKQRRRAGVRGLGVALAGDDQDDGTVVTGATPTAAPTTTTTVITTNTRPSPQVATGHVGGDGGRSGTIPIQQGPATNTTTSIPAVHERGGGRGREPPHPTAQPPVVSRPDLTRETSIIDEFAPPDTLELQALDQAEWTHQQHQQRTAMINPDMGSDHQAPATGSTNDDGDDQGAVSMDLARGVPVNYVPPPSAGVAADTPMTEAGEDPDDVTGHGQASRTSTVAISTTAAGASGAGGPGNDSDDDDPVLVHATAHQVMASGLPLKLGAPIPSSYTSAPFAVHASRGLPPYVPIADVTRHASVMAQSPTIDNPIYWRVKAAVVQCTVTRHFEAQIKLDDGTGTMTLMMTSALVLAALHPQSLGPAPEARREYANLLGQRLRQYERVYDIQERSPVTGRHHAAASPAYVMLGWRPPSKADDWARLRRATSVNKT